MHLDSVLVTGGAGDIGRGLAKILGTLPWIDEVHGMDVSDRFPSAAFYRGFTTAPPVRDPGYLDALAEAATASGAQLIIPMSEPELRFFSERRLAEIAGIPLLMPSFEVMDLGFDKLATAEYLADHGLPHPWTVRADEAGPRDLPCIMKSRTGSGSKSLFIVTEDNRDELGRHTDGMIYQELLLPDDEEYTCGVFRSRSGQLATISFRRVLAGGRTGYAEVVRVARIDELLASLAQSLRFTGSINVQLRLTDRGPVVFEINPRFSSTVVFRHLLGFRDLEWAIRDRCGDLDEIGFDPQESVGKRVFRADDELVY